MSTTGRVEQVQPREPQDDPTHSLNLSLRIENAASSERVRHVRVLIDRIAVVLVVDAGGRGEEEACIRIRSVPQRQRVANHRRVVVLVTSHGERRRRAEDDKAAARDGVERGLGGRRREARGGTQAWRHSQRAHLRSALRRHGARDGVDAAAALSLRLEPALADELAEHAGAVDDEVCAFGHVHDAPLTAHQRHQRHRPQGTGWRLHIQGDRTA